MADGIFSDDWDLRIVRIGEFMIILIVDIGPSTASRRSRDRSGTEAMVNMVHFPATMS